MPTEPQFARIQLIGGPIDGLTMIVLRTCREISVPAKMPGGYGANFYHNYSRMDRTHFGYDGWRQTESHPPIQ